MQYTHLVRSDHSDHVWHWNQSTDFQTGADWSRLLRAYLHYQRHHSEGTQSLSQIQPAFHLWEAFTWIFFLRKEEEDGSEFYFLAQVVQMDKGSELNANFDTHVDSKWAD